MNAQRIESILATFPAGSAWDRGVRETARDLLEYLELAADQPITEKALLNGAQDWSGWSYGGCGFIYGADDALAVVLPFRAAEAAPTPAWASAYPKVPQQE